MFSRNTLSIAITLAICVGGSFLVLGQDHDKSKVSTKSQIGTAKQDSNIKSKSAVNDPAQQVAAPPSKGGGTPKGIYCAVHVDNRSDWKIQIFVDGDYEGLVGAYGDLYATTVYGGTRLYGRADFTDGSSKSWGPTNIYCPKDGSFDWTLSQ